MKEKEKRRTGGISVRLADRARIFAICLAVTGPRYTTASVLRKGRRRGGKAIEKEAGSSAAGEQIAHKFEKPSFSRIVY